ncbi:MAG: flotillin family protein [Micrococcales bacterium]|nr:flotillin family protein [Micrococcales bacterium]
MDSYSYSDGTVIVAAVIGLVVFFAISGFAVSRIRRVPPNEALIVVGRGARTNEPENGGQKVVIGGRAFVWPVIQRCVTVSLEQRQIAVSVEGVDKNCVKLAVHASASFRVCSTVDGVRRAAQRFPSQQDALDKFVQLSLEGSLRSIVGKMTVQEIIADRHALSEAVVQATKGDLAEQGLQVDLLNVSDISTPGTHLPDLSREAAADMFASTSVLDWGTPLPVGDPPVASADDMPADIVDRLERLARLRAAGDLSDAQYEAAKDHVLADLARPADLD